MILQRRSKPRYKTRKCGGGAAGYAGPGRGGYAGGKGGERAANETADDARAHYLAREEISKKALDKMNKYVPMTKKRPEHSEGECATRERTRAMRQGRRCEGRGYTRHMDQPVSGRLTSRLRGSRIWNPLGCEEREGSERVCVRRVCGVHVGRRRGGRRKWRVVGNASPKWKVCHAMAICLALSQLRPESTAPLLLPHLQHYLQ